MGAPDQARPARAAGGMKLIASVSQSGLRACGCRSTCPSAGIPIPGAAVGMMLACGTSFLSATPVNGSSLRARWRGAYPGIDLDSSIGVAAFAGTQRTFKMRCRGWAAAPAPSGFRQALWPA